MRKFITSDICSRKKINYACEVKNFENVLKKNCLNKHDGVHDVIEPNFRKTFYLKRKKNHCRLYLSI